jgi:hypothetical protein
MYIINFKIIDRDKKGYNEDEFVIECLVNSDNLKIAMTIRPFLADMRRLHDYMLKYEQREKDYFAFDLANVDGLSFSIVGLISGLNPRRVMSFRFRENSITGYLNEYVICGVIEENNMHEFFDWIRHSIEILDSKTDFSIYLN